MATLEIRVPDIGDFKDVPVIEILVKPGDAVTKEAPLVTLESDKATMEVPSPHTGTVKEVRVKLGDKVAQGTVIAVLETSEAAQATASPTPAAPAKTPAGAQPSLREALTSTLASLDADLHAEVLVLGAGPGGYTAAFRAADLGKKVVLVERYPTLGGVCLNVGCIPSKALLHAAKVIADAEDMAAHGVSFGPPKIDLDGIRGFKDGVVGKLTKGLSSLAKGRKVTVVQGTAQFASPHSLEVQTAEGKKVVSFDHCIIAAGSQPAKIPGFPDDPRVMDSTGALELKDVPKRLLVIGGGIIGLEMATVYDALGSKVTVVEFMDRLIPGADPDIVKPLAKRIEKRYEKILVKTKVAKLEALPEGLRATFENADGSPGAPGPQVFDRVLLSVGRRPNGKNIGAEKAGVTVNDR
ncbi:MAG TPA: FAD-dependent oxidoreductase, partial [Usitatibacteraceae bacterium]|nr:FAD-dependent oxidoreductase [Usitatibacteraceae bacterium]